MPQRIIKLLLIIAILLVIPYAVTATDIIKGGVGIRIGSPTPKCGNTLSSCGTYPDCLNLTGISYCVNGRVVKPYCYANTPKNKTYNQACEPPVQSNAINFQLNITNGAGSVRQLVLTFYVPGTTNVINTSSINGYGSMSSANSTVDLELKFDNSSLNVVVKNLNLTKLSSGISNIIVDRLSVTIPEVDVYKAYRVELPSNFTFSTIYLSISYDNVTVRNETSLRFYKCSAFNTATNSCNDNWSEISLVSRNITSKIISLEINGFSVYALGEPKEETDNGDNTPTCDPNEWYDCDCVCGECGSCQGIRENDCGDTQGCTEFCGYCPSGYDCIDNICVERETETTTVVVICGDGYCDSGETSDNCCKDCGCPSGQECDITANICYTPEIEVQTEDTEEEPEEETNLTTQTENNNQTENPELSKLADISIPFVALWVPSAAAIFFATRWYYTQRINCKPSYINRFKRNSKHSLRKNQYSSEETRLVL